MEAVLKNRLVGVLLVTRAGIVQSERFQHTHVIHYDARIAMRSFALWALDEIVVLNVDRDDWPITEFAQLLSELTQECFLPVSAGGRVRGVDDAALLLHAGADKIVVNTLLVDDPNKVRAISDRFGSQCVVASGDFQIDLSGNEYRCLVDGGERPTALSLAEWMTNAEDVCVGEYFINSIDFDGARGGYDETLLSMVRNATNRPVIIMGGVQTWAHLSDGLTAGADAVALANQLHYVENSGRKAKKYLVEAGWPMRPAARWREGET